eukprot:scaffold34278_cov129-Isochrysis_galbana.AAC.3
MALRSGTPSGEATTRRRPASASGLRASRFARASMTAAEMPAHRMSATSAARAVCWRGSGETSSESGAADST